METDTLSPEFEERLRSFWERERMCEVCKKSHRIPMCRPPCVTCGTSEGTESVWTTIVRGERHVSSAGGHYCPPHMLERREQLRWPGIIDRHGRFATVVGELYADATVADTAFADLAIAFHRRPTQGLLIQGPVGTGKTHLAAGMARLWSLSGRSVQFVPSRRLFRAIRDTYSPNSTETEGEIVERYTEADLLVIDDLGREGRITEQVQSVLHEVLDERIRAKRPTIVTTNLGDEIATVYGDAIASRLSLLETVVIEGKDRRGA